MSNKCVTLGWRSRSSSREEVRTWKSSWASWGDKNQHQNTTIRALKYWINTINTEPYMRTTCSSNELMCQRYSLRTSSKHPASSTSSSPGSSVDSAVSGDIIQVKDIKLSLSELQWVKPLIFFSTFQKLQQCFGKLVVFARLNCRWTWKLLQPPDKGRTGCQALEQRIQEACVSYIQQTRNHTCRRTWHIVRISLWNSLRNICNANYLSFSSFVL